MQEKKVSDRSDGDKEKAGRVEGVIQIEGQSGLAKEFITIGRSFEEALGRCTIRDDEQRNAVIIYKAQLEIFDMKEEIEDLTNWLNASAAVGGINRSLASMTETKIYVPEGAGIRMDKASLKALTEVQKIRAAGKPQNSEGETHNE